MKKVWKWQHRQWPDFTYGHKNLNHLYHQLGQLKMAETTLSKREYLLLQKESLYQEAIATSLLEGDHIEPKHLRIALESRFRPNNPQRNRDPKPESLLDILLDTKRTDEPLSKARLFAWHQAMFIQEQHLSHPVRIASFRTEEEGEVKIISGTWHHEIVHYIAPPASTVNDQMQQLLTWINEEHQIDAIIKSAIAHLWFLLIHPFDDGNRRLARDISDYILSGSDLAPSNLFTLAHEIHAMKQSYYEMLDQNCTADTMDISSWVEWYLMMFENALGNALLRVQTLRYKRLIAEGMQSYVLNARQRSLLGLLLEDGIQKKQLKTAYYAQRFNTSKPTAARDLSDLAHKGFLTSHGKGRAVYYLLNQDFNT